jgi:hypothetical protein
MVDPEVGFEERGDAMARSRRKPFAYCGKSDQSKRDKKAASKADRIQKNSWLRTLSDYDNDLRPHRYESVANEVFLWHRDGRSLLTSEPAVWVSDYLEAGPKVRRQSPV